jgi:hypothetical protein
VLSNAAAWLPACSPDPAQAAAAFVPYFINALTPGGLGRACLSGQALVLSLQPRRWRLRPCREQSRRHRQASGQPVVGVIQILLSLPLAYPWLTLGGLGQGLGSSTQDNLLENDGSTAQREAIQAPYLSSQSVAA